MLVSCSYCNGRHTRGVRCSSRPPDNRKKEANYITRFRSSSLWQKKRAEIRARDKELCQVCLLDGRYVFQNLSVHHIWPVSKKWNLRLDNSNLITLCKYCHKMAEDKEIQAKTLEEIAAKNARPF